MSNASTPRGDVDIDLGRLASALWARRVRIIVAVAVAGVIALLIASAMSPLYRGEARILIEEREAPVTRTAETPAARDVILDDQAIASQVEVLRSSNLIRKVIADLQLDKLPEFDPAAEPSIVADLMVLLGLADNPLDEGSDRRVLTAFREKLEVYQVQNSRVIAIEFSSEDPELAANVANALASAYLEVQSGAKLASNADATAWLEPEIAELRERVQEAEAAVAKFRADSGLFLVAQDDTLSARQLADISGELSRVRAERADAEARAANVREALDEGRSTDTISSVLESQLIQRLRERQISIQSEIADLSATLLENHPQIRGLRSQLAGLETQIQNEIRKALASLESDAEVARLREEELVGQLNTLKANSAEAGVDEVELRALEREATAQRELLETYLARYREAVSRGDPNALPADARIIANAVAPEEPYFPKTVPIVVVVMLATALIYAIAVMLQELFSGRALRPAAPMVERAVVMAPVSSLHTEGTGTAAFDRPAEGSYTDRDLQQAVDADVARHMEQENAAEPDPEPVRRDTAREAAAVHAGVEEIAVGDVSRENEFAPRAIARRLIADRVSVIAGIAPEGDAASIGSVLLIRQLAAAGRRALLVDMTGSGAPSRLMTTGREVGVTDLLCGGISIAEAIHADRESAADIIPLGTADPERAMRGVYRIQMIIEALESAYDTVVVECGQADRDAVRRMVGRDNVALLLSVSEPDDEAVVEEMEALAEAGEGDAYILLAEEEPRNPLLNDSAA